MDILQVHTLDNFKIVYTVNAICPLFRKVALSDSQLNIQFFCIIIVCRCTLWRLGSLPPFGRPPTRQMSPTGYMSPCSPCGDQWLAIFILFRRHYGDRELWISTPSRYQLPGKHRNVIVNGPFARPQRLPNDWKQVLVSWTNIQKHEKERQTSFMNQCSHWGSNPWPMAW